MAMVTPIINRATLVRNYRYGFNGMEKDDEVAGAGNSYTAEFWQYDSRLGRRWNVDPKPNVSISPYATFSNNPVLYIDPLGDTIDILRNWPPSTEFELMTFAAIQNLYNSKIGQQVVRAAHSSPVEIHLEDASRWYLTDQGDVENSITNTPSGSLSTYESKGKSNVDIQYSSRDGIMIDGVPALAETILLHELVHAMDYASGYFQDNFQKQWQRGKDGLKTIGIRKVGEVRAMLVTNAYRKEQGQEIRTHYDGVRFLNDDGTPVDNFQEYGIDIYEGLEQYGVEKPEEDE